jgi:hypothetical protein
MKFLHEHGVVILSGRKGTGKSKMCLEIASLCEEEDYMPYKVDGHADLEVNFESSKVLCILDDCRQLLDHQKKLPDLTSQKHIWFIFTCRGLGSLKVKQILEEMFKNIEILDLDDNLTKEEKRQILKLHMEANNITETSVQDSMHPKEDVLTLHRDTIEEIINLDTEPILGFPLTTDKFCKDKHLLHLGKKYFAYPPQSLVKEIKGLYETGGRDNQIEYVLLVYMATENEPRIDIKKIDHKRCVQLQETLFKIKGNGDDLKNKIEKAAKSLNGKYLKYDGESVEFTHRYVKKAVLLSSDHILDYFLKACSLIEIKDIVRSHEYEKKGEELITKMPAEDKEEMYELLFSKLIDDSGKDSVVVKDIGVYFYNQFIKLHDKMFLTKLMCHFTPRKTSEPPQSENKKNIERKYPLSWCIILLMEELTDHGNDPWIYEVDDGVLVPDRALLCGLIGACKSKYKQDEKRDNTFSKLLSMFKSKIKDKTLVKNLSDITDMYGNTLFHYLVIFSESQSFTILDIEESLLIKNNRAIFGKPNKIGITPLAMAAYFGKLKVFKGLLVKTEQSVIEKKQGKLHKLTKDGMECHFDLGKSSKEMNIHLHFEKDVLDCIEFGTKEDFLEILKLLSNKIEKIEIREEEEKKKNYTTLIERI